jgi:hypothetical protein
MENLEDLKYRRYLKLRHFIREFSKIYKSSTICNEYKNT